MRWDTPGLDKFAPWPDALYGRDAIRSGYKLVTKVI